MNSMRRDDVIWIVVVTLIAVTIQVSRRSCEDAAAYVRTLSQ